MIRVCHILSGDLWAGAEVVVYNLLKGLKENKDIDPCVILLNRGKLATELSKLGIHLDVLDEARTSFPEIVMRARRALRRNRAQILHSHGYKESLLAYFASLTKRRRWLVATQHGMPESTGPNASLKHRLITAVNFFVLRKGFDKVVTVSDDIKRTLVNKRHFADAKVETIPNGVPIVSHRRGANGEGFVIGSSGRLVPVKDFPFMVEVAREVVRHSECIRFELAGEGPERHRIRQLIEKYGLEKNFVLRSFVEDAASFYSGLDLYLNTSIHEGMPMSVLEAMGHSIPVVAPDVGGIGEIVEDRVEGYLIKTREPKVFAEKCIELFHDDALRAEMAVASRKRISKEFTRDQMVRRYFALYLNLINTSGKS